MRLCGSFARELARPVGAYLVVFTAWALLDRAVLTQVPAQTPPAGGTAAPPAPPRAAAEGAACFPRLRRKRSRSCVRRWIA